MLFTNQIWFSYHSRARYIALEWKDYVNVFLTVLIIGGIASYFPAYMAARQKWLFRNE